MVKHADVSVDDIALHNSLIIKSSPEVIRHATKLSLLAFLSMLAGYSTEAL